MKNIKINDFIFTNDDSGLVVVVGQDCILMNNNVNTYKVNTYDKVKRI